MSSKRMENKTLMYQYDKELASAFQIDCEDFLNEFEKSQSFSFVDFQRVWIDKAFSFIYAGQTYALLLRDFVDNCYWVVKKYIMYPRSMFTQIGAFYLLYGLYYRQPLKGWVKIRLILEEYHKIYELIMEMKNRNQMDAVYIFAKMRAEEVFLYVAQRKPLGPEDRFVKGVEPYLNNTFTAAKSQSSLIKFQELPQTDLFAALIKTNAEYTELMKSISEKYPSLPSFSSNLMEDIKKAYEDFNKDISEDISVSITQESESNVSKECLSLRDRRAVVRAKALAKKDAVYRAKRKVKTAVDDIPSENSSDSLDSNEEFEHTVLTYEPSTSNCEPSVSMEEESTLSCEPSTSAQPPKTFQRKRKAKK